MRLRPGLIPALTEDVLFKLKSAGVINMLTFMERDPEDMAQETGISYKDLQSIRQLIFAQHAAIPMTGTEMLDKAAKSTVIISTGNSNLDLLLGGGLMNGEVVEICGVEGVGKTTFCAYLAIHSVLKLGFHVLYVDSATNVSFRRIGPIIEKIAGEDEDLEEPLARLKVVQPCDHLSLLQTLHNYFHPVQSEEGKQRNDSKKDEKCKLIILDSVYAYFSNLHSNSTQELAYLNQLACSLKQLAVEQELAVIVVNRAIKSEEEEEKLNQGSFFTLKPALGNYWAHVPNTRLFMEKTRVKQSLSVPGPSDTADTTSSTFNFKVTVWKSSRLKIDEASVKIF
ncbi:DNA repair protein RAD51 homolog 4-like [Palaemon carinicauda]|uniref:DNA repair protein RAD51 homolog 4-like n=1 Tax=Palaemon carinicauda TaxID=392227 RepID=UPI0035B57395